MAAEVLTDSITVTYEGDTYEFAVPSPMQVGKISLRARDLRVKAIGASGMSEYGLDGLTVELYRGMAVMELFLRKSSAVDKWPWTAKPNGDVVVDAEKFPTNRTFAIPEIYAGFEAQLNTFLGRGTGDGQPAGGEAVAS